MKYRQVLLTQCIFGCDIFYDSVQNFIFGVTSRIVGTPGARYVFRGWTGSGNGSDTSPDSTGNDTVVRWRMHNSIFETAR